MKCLTRVNWLRRWRRAVELCELVSSLVHESDVVHIDVVVLEMVELEMLRAILVTSLLDI